MPVRPPANRGGSNYTIAAGGGGLLGVAPADGARQSRGQRQRRPHRASRAGQSLQAQTRDSAALPWLRTAAWTPISYGISQYQCLKKRDPIGRQAQRSDSGVRVRAGAGDDP